jgi:polar amino acid transport system permease protein
MPMIGIKLTAVEAAGLPLALNEAPFIARSFAAMSSASIETRSSPVNPSQPPGMTPLVVMLRIVAPQAIRSMVPALGNEAVSAFKNHLGWGLSAESNHHTPRAVSEDPTYFAPASS